MTGLREELTGLLDAGVPLINLVTYEEDRMIEVLKSARTAAPRGIYTWDADRGVTQVRAGSPPMACGETTSEKLVGNLDKIPENCIVVLKDFHHAWKEKPALTTRRLRNAVAPLREKSRHLVFITPMEAVPVELKDDVHVLHVPPPDLEEMRKLVGEFAARMRTPLSPAIRERLALAALGLTLNQARAAINRARVAFGDLNEKAVDLVTEAKCAKVKESGALELWPAAAGGAVGGLDLLKEWLAKRERGFSEEARMARVEYPRGVALIGVPGTGKSLAAKMLSGMWHLPLLRLDVGAVFGPLLGDSEAAIRKALQLAELVSPSILWIDEMEKALAGSGAGAALSGGAPARVFGALLTWMQEHTTPVFVVATANDVGLLPPELMGRFERVFFLDLPNREERRAILKIHLEKTGIDFPEQALRMDDLVDATKGYVGREIQAAIREAQFTAFDDGNREMETDDLRRAFQELVPISKSHAEVVERLRGWLKEGRAFPASREEAVREARRGRSFEV